MLTRQNAVLEHHDQSPSVQQRFFAHTKALVIAFQETGNPFDEDSHEVVIIDNREVMPDYVAPSILGAHGEGKKQHADFVENHLLSATVAFHAPIKINKINLIGNRYKNHNKSKHVDSIRERHALTRATIHDNDVREGNSDRLFEVNNTDCPPSLSKHGVLRSCQNAWKYTVQQMLMKLTPNPLMVAIWCIV